MKKLALFLTFSMVAMSGLLAQAQTELFTAKIEEGQMPKDIMAAIEKDFPKMIAKDFRSIPGEFIDGTFVLNSDNVNTYNNQMYRIYLESDGFEATLYDEKGNLVSARETWKNKPLPKKVAKTIGELYPGWAMHSNYERITINKNEMRNAYYRVVLSKDDHKMKITLDELGHEIEEGSMDAM
ncbi:MAG: hypothetical protein KDC57_09460 [Saprospiraceae bacterium]|nr:hypothetical protein [Saprospiraceae bacterium]